MVEKKAQKMQKVGSSGRWSLCSDQYPSGQFPKVSIGIVVEKTPKMGSLVRKEDSAAVPGKGRASSCQEKVVKENEAPREEENKRPETGETTEVKQVEDKGQKASARFSSRSVHDDTPTQESVQFYVNRTSIIQSEDGASKKVDIVYGKRKEKGETIGKVEEVVDELAFAATPEVRVLDKGVNRDEAEIMGKCKNETLRMKLWEILGTAPSQNKHTLNSLDPEEGKENLNINHDREYHRIKTLQPKHNSDTIETDSESASHTNRRPITRSLTRRRAPPKTVSKLQGGMKSRKKPLYSRVSDSRLNLQEKNIFAFDGEGKTEFLERTIGGHSNTSKGRRNEQKTAENGPPRINPFRPLGSQKGLQPKERGKALPSPVKALVNSKETGISLSPSSQDTTDSMPTPKRQKTDRRKPCRIYSPRQLIPDKKLQSNERETTRPLPDSKSLQSRETGGSPSPCHSNKDFIQKAEIEQKKVYTLRPLVSNKNFQPNGRDQALPSPDRAWVRSKEVRNDSPHSQTHACKDFGKLQFAENAENHETAGSPLIRSRTHSREHVISPAMPNNSDSQREVGSLQSKRKTDILDDFLSPTFAMNATPTPPSSGKMKDVGFSSPLPAQPRNPTGNACSSNSRLDTDGSDANPESCDDLRGTKFQHGEEKETRNKSSLSPMEDQETQSPQADDFMRKGFRQTDNVFSLDADSPEKFASMFPESRSVLHSKGAALFPNAGSPNHSEKIHRSKRESHPKNIELEATGLPKASEYSEDSLESDVIELALVLERFKAKLKSQTSNKSSEILSTAADKIRLKLHDLESQMQADVGKFVNSGKSKRKRFESRLQGQQERLRLSHDKFKEVVNQQIQDCRATLEELEAHRMELKGSTDRQKASYRKLLLQVEEAMKAELRDAETRIAAIDKEARKKMYGLKHVLKEWMEDGVIR